MSSIISTLTNAQREALAKCKWGGHPRKYNTLEEIQQAQEARRIKDREAKRLKRSLSRSPTSVSKDSYNILFLYGTNLVYIYM